MKPHRMLARRLSYFVLASLLILLARYLQAGPSLLHEDPQQGEVLEVYFVNAGDAHFYPYWESSILSLTREDAATKVDYVSIEGATFPCDRPDVRAGRVFLPGVKIADLISNLDVCSLNPEEVELAASQSIREREMDESSRTGIVVKCGEQEKLFRLPSFQIDKEMLQEKMPDAVALLELRDQVLDRVSASQAPEWWERPSQELGQAQLPNLAAGKFDRGFWFCSGGDPVGIVSSVHRKGLDPLFGSDCDLYKLRNVLAGYRGPSPGVGGHTGQLINKDEYPLIEYISPVYPPLAIQAGIEGSVRLQLHLDPGTGTVKQVRVVESHPLLAVAAVNAAERWRFDSAQHLPPTILAVVEFSLAPICSQ